MATPYDPTRFAIPGVAPQQPTPRSPLRRPDSPANFSTPRTPPGGSRPEIPLYPGGNASKPATSVVPRPARAIAMEQGVARNNALIQTKGAEMRAAAEAKAEPGRTQRLDPSNTRDRRWGVDAAAVGQTNGSPVAAQPRSATPTVVGNGDIGRPAALDAAVARAASAPKPSAPAPATPRAPAPTDANYDPFAGYSDAELRTGKVDVTEPGTGYFVGSDGRVKRINSSYANDPKNQVPSMSRRSLGPDELAALGFANKDEGAVSLAMAPGTSPLDATYGRSAGAYASAPIAGDDPQAARINAILADPERQARINAVAAQGRAQNAAAAGQPTPGDGAPQAPASGAGLPRMSMADEFNTMREGLRRPGQYDPTTGINRARSDAFNVTNPMSRERALVDLATRLAADSNLKGRPGARNAIISSLMGQLGAGNDASLEGLRQRGQAGVSSQEFDQTQFTGEVDRRGARLRDQFLQEGDERLARMNNDDALLRTVISGEYGLASAGLRDAAGRNDARKQDNTRADDAYSDAQERFPDDPVAAAVAADNAITDMGIDNEGLYSSSAAQNLARRNILGYSNDSLFGLGNVIDNWAVGRDPNFGLPQDFDFSSENVQVDADNSWLLDAEQFALPRSRQPYTITVKGPNGEPVTQVVRPGIFDRGPDRAPSVDEFQTLQRNRDVSLRRREAAEPQREDER